MNIFEVNWSGGEWRTGRQVLFPLFIYLSIFYKQQHIVPESSFQAQCFVRFGDGAGDEHLDKQEVGLS